MHALHGDGVLIVGTHTHTRSSVVQILATATVYGEIASHTPATCVVSKTRVWHTTHTPSTETKWRALYVCVCERKCCANVYASAYLVSSSWSSSSSLLMLSSRIIGSSRARFDVAVVSMGASQTHRHLHRRHSPPSCRAKGIAVRCGSSFARFAGLLVQCLVLEATSAAPACVCACDCLHTNTHMNQQHAHVVRFSTFC